MQNGGTVDTKGKVTITELSKGTYAGGGLMNKTTTWTCGYSYEIQFTVCDGNDHHSNGEKLESEGGPCKANNPSVAILVEIYKCYDIQDPNNPAIGSPSIPVETPGSPATEEPVAPINCTTPGALTGPQDPTTGTGEGGCNVGIPTLPNLEIKTTPCQKTKAMLENPAVQTELDSLKKKSTEEGEIGFKIKNDGTTSGIIDGGKHEVDLGDMTGWQGSYHNHTPTGIPMHSPPDIDNGLLRAARSQLTGEHNNAYFGMIFKKACSTCTGGFKMYHYVIRFNGTYTDATTTFSQEKLDKLKLDYQKREKELSETLPYVDFLGAANLNNKGLEKLFFETLTNMNIPHNVVTLQRVDDDGNGNITVNNITLDANGIPQATPCP